MAEAPGDDTSPHHAEVPHILVQPQKQTDVQPGASATFSVQAAGMNLSYSWHRNDEPIVSGDRIQITSDDSTSTLKVKNVQSSSDEGSYICKITNRTGGSVETEPAKLTIRTVHRRNCIVCLAVPVAIVVVAVLIALLQGVSVRKPWHSSKDTLVGEAQEFITSSDKDVLYKGGKPSLLILTKFPGKSNKFNVLERIGRNYDTFGMFLLQDHDGAKVRALKDDLRNPFQICKEILQLWLRGRGKQPVTYATLVDCLRDAELNALAKDIEDVLQ